MSPCILNIHGIQFVLIYTTKYSYYIRFRGYVSIAKYSSNKLRINLRRFRKLRGMTQTQMGERAGLGAASISHFETGQRTPTLETLIKLADALNVNVDALLGRAPVESSAHVDPIFLKASRADVRTLETIRHVAAAILADANKSH